MCHVSKAEMAAAEVSVVFEHPGDQVVGIESHQPSDEQARDPSRPSQKREGVR